MTVAVTALEREAEARGAEGQREHERRAVAEHYEHHPEIFSLVLDQRLAYATGIFERDDEDLETAQARKYAWVAEQLAIQPGERVLDVGCGWGSNLLYLAEHTRGVFRGVTLSPRQREEALARAGRAGVGDRVTIDVAHIDAYELEPQSFDAILFSGSIVHMHDREAVYDRVARVLRPGGRLLISDCFYPVQPRGDRDSDASRYILETVLGYCRLLHLSEELRLVEGAGLDVARVEDLTTSYVHTLRHWIDNVRVHRDRIDALSPGFADALQAYMTVARLTFMKRAALEYMIVARKPRA